MVINKQRYYYCCRYSHRFYRKKSVPPEQASTLLQERGKSINSQFRVQLILTQLPTAVESPYQKRCGEMPKNEANSAQTGQIHRYPATRKNWLPWNRGILVVMMVNTMVFDHVCCFPMQTLEGKSMQLPQKLQKRGSTLTTDLHRNMTTQVRDFLQMSVKMVYLLTSLGILAIGHVNEVISFKITMKYVVYELSRGLSTDLYLADHGPITEPPFPPAHWSQL